jgi:hypothetical protein
VGRRLPEPIERDLEESDDAFAARVAGSKRRLQVFKRLYQNYYYWCSLREAGDVGDVLSVEGVDYYLGDLLVGIDTLPRRQRQAFELICMRGFTEAAATAILLPDSKWTTPVQQYSDDGLKKMVAAYDAQQAGVWNPAAVVRRQPARKKDGHVTPTVPIPEGQRKWDWSTWSEDHHSLAAYINAETGLEITPAQVKAVSFLRRPWYASPEQVAERQRRTDEREAEKAKFAYETPDQRKKRFAANRALKSQERALEQAQKLMDQVKKLRVEAGLDPETGEPL